MTMSDFDAGLLNDFGGGDVEWWHDYIRTLLGASEDYYNEQMDDCSSQAWLGNATTAELLEELQSRAEVGGYANYKTTDDT